MSFRDDYLWLRGLCVSDCDQDVSVADIRDVFERLAGFVEEVAEGRVRHVVPAARRALGLPLVRSATTTTGGNNGND